MKLALYREVQNIARQVHGNLCNFINSESTELAIAEKAKQIFSDFGITDTWYHGVPAFVLLGSRSCLSISGKNYKPATEIVGEKNLVTVDLSPMMGGIWGDCARSYFVENGICTLNPASKEFIEGICVEKELHKKMISIVTPDLKFSELYKYGNDLIIKLGYENLDFLNNLGHSIETSTTKRRFIDKECHER